MRIRAAMRRDMCGLVGEIALSPRRRGSGKKEHRVIVIRVLREV